MYLDQFFSEALGLPAATIGYHVSRTLAQAFPDRVLIEGYDYDFDLPEYARAGHCALRPEADVHHQFSTMWDAEKGILLDAVNAWYEVDWQGHVLDVILMSWDDSCCQHYWILAESRAVADRFFEAVCRWNPEVRGEILVYDGGSWTRSESLYKAIRGATFDDLILEGTLKRDIREDLDRFFASRDLYDEHGIPWKRGILFVGPPGNGKTHAVKALVNTCGRPCLYIKSFDSEKRLDKSNMRAVFDRARKTAPCLLVLEDLDSHVDDENRSFFLNELDGFAENRGVAILATTNHPEKLDPAILDRPSRFDRKYTFGLPATAERHAYLARWSATWRPALRPSEAGVLRAAELTEGFSFAYLKELCLASMMRWIDSAAPGSMDDVLAEQAVALRSQMGGPKPPAGDLSTEAAGGPAG